MLEAPAPLRTDWLLVYGPWILMLAVAGAFALVYARRAIRSRGGAVAGRVVNLAAIFGGIAFVDMIGLALTLRHGHWESLLPIVLAVVLLFCLIGLAGCVGYTVWRMIATVAPRTPLDPPVV
jgi:hypothetical protein